MPTNHAPVATHTQSLPSFAQAFSNHSLNNLSTGNNALPPIQSRISPSASYRVDSPSASHLPRPPSNDAEPSKPMARKRPHKDITSASRDDEYSGSEHNSPRPPQVKEEQDQDTIKLDKSHDRRMAPEDDGAPPSPTSADPSPKKKRRVTPAGDPPLPLNTDMRPSIEQTSSTPISPVVMGFPINRDNPAALEQVRSAISVKQQQKALIEQRRGSITSTVVVVSPVNPSSAAHPPPLPTTPSEERISTLTSKNALSSRTSRRSPNSNSNNPPHTAGRRAIPSTSQPTAGSTRSSSPNPILASSGGQAAHLHPPSVQSPSHPHHLHTGSSSTQTLPFPPISFARRRAGFLGMAGKKKPADILISPREEQSSDRLQPAIQSAPPVPHLGQGSFQAARMSMALPRVPPVLNATTQNVRRVASNVPPTPTRLALRSAKLTPAAAITGPNTATPSMTTTNATPMVSISGRSPPAASVPIASTLVPPTPASLHHPSYTNEKSAFLAPFEMFYDSLNHSKQLKTWLAEQLQKSNALMQSLERQQERIGEVIEAAVEKRVAGMRAEIVGLKRKVEELEEAARIHSGKGKQPVRNGNGHYSPSESYTFPSAPISVPMSSWSQEREREREREREGRTNANIPRTPSMSSHPYMHPHAYPAPHSQSTDRARERDESDSPVPYEGRRLASSVSATRLDPPARSRESENVSSSAGAAGGSNRVGLSSPSQALRETRSGGGQRREKERDERDNKASASASGGSKPEGNTPSPPSVLSHSPRSVHNQRAESRGDSVVMGSSDVPAPENS